jgi:hypothetical protein
MDGVDSFDWLRQKKAELETRAGRLRPEGLTEFVQLAEKAFSVREASPAEAEKLRTRACDMLPRVEKALEQAVAIRDRIKAKMMGHAAEAMERYSDVLRELAK